jgi:hypothetical protein
MLTSPPIHVAQNRADSVRMVAAQARLYADVKKAQWSRFGAMAFLGVVVAVISLATGNEGAVGSVGGVVLLFANGLLMYRERRRVSLAVSVQEFFDCSVLTSAGTTRWCASGPLARTSPRLPRGTPGREHTTGIPKRACWSAHWISRCASRATWAGAHPCIGRGPGP